MKNLSAFKKHSNVPEPASPDDTAKFTNKPAGAAVILYYIFILAIIVIPSAGFAALTQPNGSPIPSFTGCNAGNPSGLAAIFAGLCLEDGVSNIGDACPAGPCDDGQNGTCETTLWHEVNDNSCIPSKISGLNPWNDAALTPETITPGCTIKFTMVSRGSAIFKDVFGWYNVTGSKPAAEDLHVIFDCNTDAGTTVELDIKNDPDWKGGPIGFFLISSESQSSHSNCDIGDCCATTARYSAGAGYAYFSQRAFNDDYTGTPGTSFIHLLIYQSRITEGKYYLAWEDLYGGSNNNFTDVVTSIENIQCPSSPGSSSGSSSGCGFGKGSGDATSSALIFGYVMYRGYSRKKDKRIGKEKEDAAD